MAATGFARLKPQAAKGMDQHPPTPSDAAQSAVHHVNSVQFNLPHAITHLQEAQRHANKLNDVMAALPQTAPHVQALQRALGGPSA